MVRGRRQNGLVRKGFTTNPWNALFAEATIRWFKAPTHPGIQRRRQIHFRVLNDSVRDAARLELFAERACPPLKMLGHVMFTSNGDAAQSPKRICPESTQQSIQPWA